MKVLLQCACVGCLTSRPHPDIAHGMSPKGKSLACWCGHVFAPIEADLPEMKEPPSDRLNGPPLIKEDLVESQPTEAGPATVPPPHCFYGYPEGQLLTFLPEGTVLAFQKWMIGQPTYECTGRAWDTERGMYSENACGPHGTVYSALDLHAFLTGKVLPSE